MYLKANGQILQTGLDKKNIRFQINRNLCPYSDLEMVKKNKNRWDENVYSIAFTFACKTFVMTIIGSGRKNYM